MEIKQRLEQDLKQAMLARDSARTTVLRGLKSAVLYAEVAAGSRDSGGLTDAEIIILFQKEAKKRQDTADLYEKAGEHERAAAELYEKEITEVYLPAQVPEAEIAARVDTVIAELGATDTKQLGQVIGKVKQDLGVAADPSIIARLAKERLGSQT